MVMAAYRPRRAAIEESLDVMRGKPGEIGEVREVVSQSKRMEFWLCLFSLDFAQIGGKHARPPMATGLGFYFADARLLSAPNSTSALHTDFWINWPFS